MTEAVPKKGKKRGRREGDNADDSKEDSKSNLESSNQIRKEEINVDENVNLEVTSEQKILSTKTEIVAAKGSGELPDVNNGVNNSALNQNGASRSSPAPPDTRKYRQNTLAVYGMVSDTAALRKEISDRDARIEELESTCAQQAQELDRRDQNIRFLANKVKRQEERIAQYQNALRVEMLSTAKTAQSEARRLLHQKQFELGHILSGGGREVWVQGNTMRSIIYEEEELLVLREEVASQKKAALSVYKQKKKEKDDEETSAFSDVSDAILRAKIETEIQTAKLNALNNRLSAIEHKKADLELEKKAFLKEIRRITDEDASEFLRIHTIGDHHRFVLLHLLGKGGFSEVWKAFDCVEAHHVACKIHRVNKDWPLQTRTQYLRHAERELQITRQLDHPNLTRLYEVFQLNDSMFVSVMEFCKGTDLDTYLKRYHTLKESDAQLIVEQIASGLRYLASLENPIIHYDLKPANILLCSEDNNVFDIKITDFGLSKIIGQTREGPSDNPSIELTSQGTGTYWYLPPECFETSETPRISNKVDVWSVGIILYQMLFGKRPFAEGESQRKIWQEKLIVSSARNLVFPETHKVSENAMNVIRRCLAFNVSERYDIFQLCQDPFITNKGSGRKHHNRAASTTAMVPPTISSSDLPS